MNTRFDKRLANIPSEIITKIARIDELKGRWVGGLQLNPGPSQAVCLGDLHRFFHPH